MYRKTGITSDMTVREILKMFPASRAVFDKYGMMGCGGAEGPAEPVSFFAEMHGLTTAELLSELRSALQSNGDPCRCGPAAAGDISPRAAGLLSAPDPNPEGSKCTHGDQSKRLARTFIRTALVVFLAYGGAVGAWAFLSLVTPGVSLPSVLTWPALVQSHAHAQIVGFAAMFIFGISYHVMPRFMGVPLQNVAAAWVSFGLLLGGMILRCLYQPFAHHTAAGVTALLGSAMEVGAAVAYLTVVRATLREHKRTLAPGRAGQPFVHVAYLIIGSLALLASTLVVLAGSVFMLVRQVNLQPPHLNMVWIHLSVVGFAGMFIFGVGQRTMPHFLGLEHTRPAAGKAALVLLTIGLLLQIATLAIPAQKILSAGSALFELAGFIFVLLAVPLFGRLPVHRPAAPPLFALFVRTAFAWGLAGSAGFAAVAIAEAAGAVPSRVIVDACRHAWTLGFMTTLIVGVAYRLVPIFFGREIHRPGWIPVIYAVLTAAVAIRVGADIASLWAPAVYPWTAVSGLLVLSAVLHFTIEIWRLTARDRAAADLPRGEISDASNVGAVLEAHPELLPVFLRHGFGALQNPVARKTVARFVTIGQAARKHGVDTAHLIHELNSALQP
ncbi:MAG: hypothetical protein A3G34_12455 [Candidatus Lindowbacteria bacterium RIFCSPLOWO2_12_FULL_62_27]|nr:MAG: hypothetical protein A3G34_12455 [Candidatus Lindowbacteria bacterium RIFCSPLOWO2_12_FULL_62_27]